MRMAGRDGQAGLGVIIAALLGICALVFIIPRLPAENLFILLFALLIFFVAFLRTDFALVILIFSMLLSPEFRAGQIIGRSIVVRTEDIFLLTVFFGWLAKMAVNKELGFLKSTLLNRPIFLYISVCIVATAWGIFRSNTNFAQGFFYILKYVEYFILFFMVVNNLKDRKQAVFFVYTLLFVCLLVSLYGCIAHFFIGDRGVAAPFDYESGTGSAESNTFGGYLAVMISVSLSLLISLRSSKARVFLIVILAFAVPALLFTLSRGAWLGAIAMFATLFIFGRKARLALFACFAVLIILSPFILPKFVSKRVVYTFSSGQEYNILGQYFKVEDSAAARIDIWRTVLEKMKKEPLLGYGVGGFAVIIDNQYARVLADTGLIGFFIFIYLLFRLFKAGRDNLRTMQDDEFAYGLSLGFIGAGAAICAQGLTAETFILIRIMEPFWFMAAIIVMLPHLGADLTAKDQPKETRVSFEQ